MRYAILLERTNTGFSAYVPDLPGCVAAGETPKETINLIREAISFHLEGMRLHGESISEPVSTCEYVEVPQPQERSHAVHAPRSLVEGQRLDQPTFHSLYEAMPPGTRAELIGGVVYMPSPVGRAHGRAQVPVIVWIDYYAENTPGVEVLDYATAILGWKSEPQPDVMLRVEPKFGGRTHDLKGFVRGAPELVVEVAKATRYVDLGPKLSDYEHAGVVEYIVRALKPDEILWFEQQQGAIARKEMDADGIYRSGLFPGLWLDPGALLKGDRRRLRAVIDLGCATPEHAAFVSRLAAIRKAT